MKISKKASLIILGITSLILTRTMLMLIDDPEGPNLLIVVVMSAVVYGISLLSYFKSTSFSNEKKTSITFLFQIIIVALLYYFLK